MIYNMSTSGLYDIHIVIDDTPIQGSPHTVDIQEERPPEPPKIEWVGTRDA